MIFTTYHLSLFTLSSLQFQIRPKKNNSFKNNYLKSEDKTGVPKDALSFQKDRDTFLTRLSRSQIFRE